MGPQLLLQAFLHCTVDGRGRIEREYGLGYRRTDLLIIWPKGGQVSRFVIECKLLHQSREQTLREGLDQTAAYMARCGTQEGHLVIFDHAGDEKWEDKIFRRQETVGSVEIEVWGM